MSLVDVRDIAAVALPALTEDGRAGKVYDLTRPEALSHAELATQLDEVSNTPVEFGDVPPAIFRDSLISFGFPHWQADGH